jgi:ATP-dependent DNA helicase RecQ
MLFPELKPFQKQALDSLARHPHTLLIAATGSGKSLIFQKYLYETRAKTRALLISPLNALARQLADGLKSLGLNVSLGTGRAGDGPPQGAGVWILSPEKVMGAGFKLARSWQPNFLIVDEAHCIWEWGEKFRPDFAEIPKLIQTLQIEKSFWCSATLPISAKIAIQKELPQKLNTLGEFSLPESLKIDRREISSHQKLSLLRSILPSSENESGMIFVSTRDSAERLCVYLNAWGFESIFYHAGLSSEERIGIEKHLQQRNTDVPVWIIATSAFGMGMNYSFLKRCIVFDPSLSLLSLAQAMGRVGRSGAHARAEILWNSNDFLSLGARMTDPKQIERLKEVENWCKTLDCPRVHLENYFKGEQKSGTFEG